MGRLCGRLRPFLPQPAVCGFNENSRPGASVRRWRLSSAIPFTQSKAFDDGCTAREHIKPKRQYGPIEGGVSSKKSRGPRSV
jgi:hypothetical protein